MQSACSHGVKSRSWLCKLKLLPKTPSCLAVVDVPMLHRRAYSFHPLSLSPGRPILGPYSQQHWTSPSSTLTHRNLSAAAIQVGRFLWLFLVFMLKKLNWLKSFRFCVIIQIYRVYIVYRFFLKYELAFKRILHINLFYLPTLFRASVVCASMTSWTLESLRKMYAVLSPVRR